MKDHFPFLPGVHLLSVVKHVDNLILDREGRGIENHVYSTMRQMIADKIVTDGMKSFRGDFVTEYRLQVYVLNADQLAEMIQSEAMRIFGYMSPMEPPR